MASLHKRTSRKRPALRWDELRLVLAIGRAGSLSGGSRRLGVTHSTAYRQLGALETRLGVRLFERARDGYSATPAGEAALAAADNVDQAIDALERRLAGQDLRASGTVRVTTTDSLIDMVVPLLGDFRLAHPEITIELVADNAFYTLTRRDADVAIRPVAEPPETLVGRRIAAIASALYAAPAYLKRRAPGTALATHDWIAPDDSLAHLGAARWLERTIPIDRVVCRSNSLLALHAAACAGLGVAPLPCFLGDADRALVRVHPPLPEMASALWLLTHADLRRVARVRTFLDAMAALLAPQRALLEGRGGRAARSRVDARRGGA